MKTKFVIKSLITTSTLFLSLSVFAENVFFKSPEVNGKIHVSDNLVMTDWQAVMSCHFDYKGSRKGSTRYPQTFLKKISANEYSLTVRKGSLTETLPRWRLLTCAYKMILIGKNTDSDKSVLGEIYLMGQEHGEMEAQELKDMQNKEFVGRALADKTRDLRLTILPEGGIVTE